MLAAACSSEGVPDERLEGLVHPARTEPPAIDVGKAGKQVDELVRAARLPHRKVAAALGAHAFRGRTSVQVSEGGRVIEQLDVDTQVLVDGAGGRHCKRDNSQDYGAEMIFAGGTVYVRPKYSKFHRRPPTDPDEPLRFCDETFAELGDHLELVAAGAELSDRGPVDVAGRRGRRIELALAPTAREPRKETAPERAWRQTIAVRKLAGEVILDEDTGGPLAGKLEATLTYQREGRTHEMTFTVTHKIETIGAVPTIAAPPEDQTVATYELSREAEEREKLLQGIAPPARRAPTPDSQPRPPAGAGPRAP